MNVVAKSSPPSPSYLLFLKFFILAYVFIYFALPKSFDVDYFGAYREVSYSLGFWFQQRYLLVALALIFLIVSVFHIGVTRRLAILMVIGVAVSTAQLYFNQYFGYYVVIGGAASAYVVRSIDVVKLGKKEWVFVFCCLLLYASQYLFYRINGRITASFLDPNISGYYFFLSYLLLRGLGSKLLNACLITIAIIGLSRNLILAIVVFELISFLSKKLSLANIFLRVKGWWLVLGSILLVVWISFFYVNNVDFDEGVGGGEDRLTTVADSSNYLRFMANVEFLERVSEGEFWLVGNGSKMDEKSTHRPHNAFFRASYRYGILLAFIGVLFFLDVLKVFQSQYALIFSLFAYYCLLNDFITGNEIVLLSIVLGLKYKMGVKKNEGVD